MSESANGAPTPTPEEAMKNAPDPAMMQQLIEGQARIAGAAVTLGFVTNHVANVLSSVTSNNPRLSLAVANELVLMYTEAMRRSIHIVDTTAPAAATEAPGAPEQEQAASDV